jgi:hypothetical protein
MANLHRIIHLLSRLREYDILAGVAALWLSPEPELSPGDRAES